MQSSAGTQSAPNVDFGLLENRFHPGYLSRTATRTQLWFREWLRSPVRATSRNQSYVLVRRPPVFKNRLQIPVAVVMPFPGLLVSAMVVGHGTAVAVPTAGVLVCVPRALSRMRINTVCSFTSKISLSLLQDLFSFPFPGVASIAMSRRSTPVAGPKATTPALAPTSQTTRGPTDTASRRSRVCGSTRVAPSVALAPAMGQ